MKLIFISLWVTVILSSVKCGLIMDFFSSVSKDANKIHENIHNVFVKSHRNESTTEHPSRGIIGNVLGSVEKKIQKVSEIRKSIHQDIFNTLHKKDERKEEASQHSTSKNTTYHKTQDVDRNEKFNISGIATSSSEDKNNMNAASNISIILGNATVDSIVANKTNAQNISMATGTASPLIDIRQLPTKSTTLKPKTNTSEIESAMNYGYDKTKNISSIDNYDTEVLEISIPFTDYKKYTALNNDTSGIVKTNKTSFEENLQEIETTSPVVNVQPLLSETTVVTSKTESTSLSNVHIKTKNITSIDKYGTEIFESTTPFNNDKNNTGFPDTTLNKPIVLSNISGVVTIDNTTSAQENLEAIETTSPLIDVRQQPSKLTTVKPKNIIRVAVSATNLRNEDHNKTQNESRIEKYDAEVLSKTNVLTNDKNNTMHPNSTLNIPIFSSNTSSVAIISNKTSAEENPEPIESTNPLIDIRLRPIKAKTITSEEDIATSPKEDDKSKIIEDIVVFPDEARKLKKIAKKAEKTREIEKKQVQSLSEIVFRDPDKPVAPCPPALVIYKGTCVPSRESFKGDCPSGFQRADDKTCEEVV